LEDIEPSDILFFNTLIAYYTSYDPRTLSDYEWALTVKHIKDIRIAENTPNEKYR
jgi:hypothetical protein